MGTNAVHEVVTLISSAGMRSGAGDGFNLLIPNQQPTNQWFQRFPKHFREHK